MTVQQRLCNNKWFRLAVSVILTLAVVTVFVCAPFAQAHAIAGVDDALIVIVIAGLAAAGITFTTTGAFESVADYVGDLVTVYAAENNTTAVGLFSDVQYSNNKVGQLLLNNRFVQLISNFAEWIKESFTLGDNANITLIEEGTKINGLTAYTLPVAWRNSGYSYEWTIVSSQDEVYCIFGTLASNLHTPYAKFFSYEPATLNVKSFNQYGESNTTHTLSHSNTFTMPYYYQDNKSLGDYANVVTWYEYNEWYSAMTQSNIEITQNSVGVGVKTGVITPPLDDEDYEEGDGALVDVGTTWGGTLKDILDKIRSRWQSVQTGEQDVNMEFAGEGEIEAQLPEQTDIENLPGGTAWNPTDQQLKFFEFESIWHYVAQWIQDFTAGASVVWNAAIQLPSPVVNMVYAMVTLSIIFGVIKVMRA